MLKEEKRENQEKQNSGIRQGGKEEGSLAFIQ